MTEKQKHIVPEGVLPTRLSDYGARIIFGFSRAGFNKAIKRGEIYVNGITGTSGRIISSGMELKYCPEAKKTPKIYHTALEVIYEDDHLAVVRKPGGMVVSGNQFQTVENALPDHLQTSKEQDALEIPRAIHRLDAPTSGMVIIAKTKNSRIFLGKQMEEKKINKKYTAVVIGKTPDSWASSQPIDDKKALTLFRKIESVPSLVSDTLTLIEAEPVTGRTHQIRKHLYRDDHPILGDKTYAREGFVLKGKGLFLCATELSFYHPSGNEKLNFSIQPPAKFFRFMQGEERRFWKYSKTDTH
ncbi:MAG: RluA family pseudouridine synthase [Bacteroidales bacterium]